MKKSTRNRIIFWGSIILFICIIIIFRNQTLFEKSYTIPVYGDCYKPFIKKDKDIIVRTVWKIIDSVKKNVADSNIEQAQKYWTYTYGINGRANADSVWVNTLYYSPDCRKTIAFINIRSLNSLPGFNYEYKYDCNIIIGIRDSLGYPWKLYGSDRMRSYGFETANEAFQQTFRYYVDDYMRTDGALVFLPDGNKGVARFGYNLTDSVFWDSCLLWRPNARGNGVYLFQTWTSNISEDQQLPDINVELTESELELFRREKAVCK